jgi:hypothetical protein
MKLLNDVIKEREKIRIDEILSKAKRYQSNANQPSTLSNSASPKRHGSIVSNLSQRGYSSPLG